MNNNDFHIFWNPDCLAYDTGRGCYEYEASPLMEVAENHPENPERLINVKSILERGPVRDSIKWHQGRLASREEIELFMDSKYLDEVSAAETEFEKTGEVVRIDGSGTVVSKGTVQAVRAAAGCGLDALGALIDGRARWAYCMVRPPGHHASRNLPDGNCIINNIGVVVEAARKRGVKRIAVLDWDVHHGNGTQTGFYDRDDVFTISIHMPLGSWGENHPESGEADEVGQGAGKGYNLNIPLPYGSGDIVYQAVIDQLVKPALDRFKPDLLIIGSGQDANQFDANGRNLLSMGGFYALGLASREIADEHCGGRLLLMQEGGYAITYTAFCMYATIEGILKIDDPMEDPIAYDSEIEQPEHAIAQLFRIRETWEKAAGRPLF